MGSSWVRCYLVGDAATFRVVLAALVEQCLESHDEIGDLGARPMGASLGSGGSEHVTVWVCSC